MNAHAYIAQGKCHPSRSHGYREMAIRRAVYASDDERFLTALYRYGLKHGLPNMSPREIRGRLREVGQ